MVRRFTTEDFEKHGFPIPMMTQDNRRRVERSYRSYNIYEDVYYMDEPPRLPGPFMYRVMEAHKVDALAGSNTPVMWHPHGQLDWAADPFEPLYVVSKRWTANGSQLIVTVQGGLSNIRARRKLDLSGNHHETEDPVFVKCTIGPLSQWQKYFEWCFSQFKEKTGAEPLGWYKTPAACAADKMGAKLIEQLNKPEAKEDTTMSNVNILNSLKTEISAAAKRGGKVAVSCAAADVLVKQARKLLGKHYPKFFTESPFGKVLEPVVVCAAVMATGYAVQAYGGTKLPFHDTVMDGARFAMEGKIRDALGVLVGPVTDLFTKLGAELGKTEKAAA